MTKPRHYHEQDPADPSRCVICHRGWAAIEADRDRHRRWGRPADLERSRRAAAWRALRGARRPGPGDLEDSRDVAEAVLVLAIEHAATVATAGVMATRSPKDALAWRLRAGLLQLVADAITADFQTERSDAVEAALARLTEPEEDA